jgi:hypothetical protein
MILLTVLLGLTAFFALTAFVNNSLPSWVATKLGVHYPKDVTAFKVGESYQCKVVTTAKLVSFGFTGIHVDDKVTVKAISLTKIKVTSGAVNKFVVVDQAGNLKLGGDEAD